MISIESQNCWICKSTLNKLATMRDSKKRKEKEKRKEKKKLSEID